MRQDRKNVSGWVTIGDKRYYFKSLLELRWAWILEVCKRHPNIAYTALGYYVFDWQYEPQKFRFYGDDIKASKLKGKEVGVRTYIPDFKVFLQKGIIWHECKGAMLQKDKTKLRCFKLYYPKERVLVVVSRLPKGLTKKSRVSLRRFSFLSDLGYRVREMVKLYEQLKIFMG